MTTVDTHFTIRARERTEIKVRGSRFIASVAPVTTKEDAVEFVESIRKEFYDATHNCYAYRLGATGLLFRTADDGEPNGSAGKPILFSIQKYGVSDVVLVVTRYFGGTKLGVGGLARAYTQAADDALALCEKIAVTQTTSVKVFCVYEDVAIIKRLMNQMEARYDEEYRDAVEFVAYIPQSRVDEFLVLITESTNGRAGAVLL